MTQPVWRSLQYVPAHVDKYVDAAHTRGADAIILDLEDSVPAPVKDEARAKIEAAAAKVSQAGADVLVRINSAPGIAAADIQASVGPNVAALCLTKVDNVKQLQRLEAEVSQAEAQRGLRPGHTRFWILIESAAGFLEMAAIARGSERNAAISLGGEDFALDLGVEPHEEVLLMPRQQLIIAAAAAGIMPLGVLGGIARFDDPAGYLEMAKRSRRFGFVGASCIHPSQIPLLNEAFSPGSEEVAYAGRVEREFAAAEATGLGAFAIDGKMIDLPIVLRARKLLARHAAIQAREARMQLWKGSLS